MTLTDRDLCVLMMLARYFLLDRVRLQFLCFECQNAGTNVPRIARRRLQSLVHASYVNRNAISAAPVYFLAKRGTEVLAEHFGDDRYLLLPTRFPQIGHLFHALAVADTHIALDRAIALQSDVQLDRWINEFEVVNHDEKDSERHFRLFTLIRESPSKLVCVPDSAFQICYRGHRGVFYLEQDRARSGAKQICAKKINGYRGMAERQLHRRHFPSTTLDRFTVLSISPNPNPTSFPEANKVITPETFLFEPILYPAVGDPVPMVKRPAPSDEESR